MGDQPQMTQRTRMVEGGREVRVEERWGANPPAPKVLTANEREWTPMKKDAGRGRGGVPRWHRPRLLPEVWSGNERWADGRRPPLQEGKRGAGNGKFAIGKGGA